MEINKKPLKISRAKKVIIALIIIAILGGGVYIFAQSSQKTNTKPSAPSGVKLKPATKEEKKEAEQKKEEIVKQDEQQNNPPVSAPAGKKQVSVVITNANSNMVNAYVSGVFEEGGTCSATFTQGATSVTRTSQGFANVSYTQCAPITPDLPSGGSWSVVVSYSSASAEGKSQTQTF